MGTNYSKGMNYEQFIHRSNQKYDRTNYDASATLFESLMDIEQGDKTTKDILGSYSQQLVKIKSNLNKAFNKFYKIKKIPVENIERLKQLNTYTTNAQTTDQLLAIIEEAMELTKAVSEFHY